MRRNPRQKLRRHLRNNLLNAPNAFLACGRLVLLALVAWPAHGQWRPVGPYGGDVRSLAADPTGFPRLFLGTSNSQIYASADGGRHWTHLSELAPRDDLVIDDLVADPRNPRVLYAGAWSVTEGGGVFRSTDGGRTWTDLRGMSGHSVRALVMAPGRPDTLVAGALDGVFRSNDAGRTWQRISPENDPEIRNLESLAVDPDNPNVIYAGTWHLPWKTTNGGESWFSIKSGIIEDSDVFSIAVDWSSRQTVFLSACSGIYRTDNAGQHWRKILGIPYSARRTRVIRQDPHQAQVFYAGTTEGLWKTASGGAEWRRLTPASLIVNDLLVDPSDASHLFLATDRAGVMESRDGGENFRLANNGFSHRQVAGLFFDAKSGLLLASVLHDKEYGGVFAGTTGLLTSTATGSKTRHLHGDGDSSATTEPDWRQWSQGLEGRDVLSLARMPGGDLLAGTVDGLFRFNEIHQAWERTGRLLRMSSQAGGKRTFDSDTLSVSVQDLAMLVPGSGLRISGAILYAATGQAVLRSSDEGRTWLAISPPWSVDCLAVSGSLLVVAESGSIHISPNDGGRWLAAALPGGQAPVSRLAIAGNTLYAATGRGLFRSADSGRSWEHKGNGVPFGPVSDVLVDPRNPGRVYVVSLQTHSVYYSLDGGQSYLTLDRGGLVGRQPRRLLLNPQGDLHVASGYDGLFALTKMPDPAAGDRR